MFVSIFLLSRYKSKLSNNSLLEYEKKVKPKFMRYYLVGVLLLLPLPLILSSDNFDVSLLKYSWIIILFMLTWNVFTIVRINTLIESTDNHKELKMFRNFFALMIFGKFVSISGLFIYLHSLLFI